MKKYIFIFCLIPLFFSVNAEAGDPVKNIIDEPIPVNIDGSKPEYNKIKEAVISACRTRGWNPIMTDEGDIAATITVRSKHYAKIKIVFSREKYSILYEDSRDLDYKGKKGTIHRNYNRWVVMLSQTIQKELGIRAQNY